MTFVGNLKAWVRSKGDGLRLLGLLALAAGVVFSSYFAEPINLQKHNQFLRLLGLLQQDEARLGEAVLELNFRVATNYDRATQLMTSLQRNTQQLHAEAGASPLKNDADFSRELTLFAGMLQDKEDALAAFKSYNAMQKNSLIYLPRARDALLGSIAPSVVSREEMAALMEYVLLQRLGGHTLDTPRYEATVQKLQALQRQGAPKLSAQAMQQLTIMLGHLRTVDTLKSEMPPLVARLMSKQGASPLRQAYQQFYDKQQRYARVYRIVLLLATLLLIAFAGVTIRRLSVQARSLTQSSQELKATIDSLHLTQGQLVQREKMASLGHLIAGVAHEVNTPIGAIKSSGKNITDSLEQALGALPVLFQQLEPNLVALTIDLMRCSTIGTAVLSTREERNLTRKLTQRLQEAGVAEPDRCASVLVQLQSHESVDSFLPLLLHPQYSMILDAAYSFGTITRNAHNINTAVERVAKIVFSLRTFSRQTPSDHFVPTNVREGLDSVLTIYHNQIKQGTELVLQLDEVPLLTCLPDELNQVWTNLIQNALQAMKFKGTLTVRLEQVGNDVVVSITDTGSGIPDAVKGRIFDEFFTTKPAGEGTGLGLGIVRKIILAHGGNIDVASVVGAGTTFTVRLPYGYCQPSQD